MNRLLVSNATFLVPTAFRESMTGGLPHPRGGVSSKNLTKFGLHMSSPPAWGCFYSHIVRNIPDIVFPTRVGVFLPEEKGQKNLYCLPHPRGGVSYYDVPSYFGKLSSPPAWGCFYGGVGDLYGHGVFPTRVGVFLFISYWHRLRGCLPHPRGGVSFFCILYRVIFLSSPPAWGCFRRF